MKVYEYNNPFSNDNLLLRVEFLGRAYIIRLAFSVEDTGYEFERPDVSPIIREMRRPDGTKIEEEDVASDIGISWDEFFHGDYVHKFWDAIETAKIIMIISYDPAKFTEHKFCHYWDGKLRVVHLKDFSKSGSSNRRIEFEKGGPTEEGYYHRSVSYWISKSIHGHFVYRCSQSEGRDCDGRHAHEQVDRVPLAELGMRPEWERVKSRNYDQFAQAAGY